MDIVERFINYTKINTTTSRENGAKGIMPSSPGQMKLAKLLVSELEALRDPLIISPKRNHV